MSMKPCLVLFVFSSLLLCACGGEFAYKAGAGADELNRAKLECSKAGGPYEACMKAKGWAVHKLDENNPLAVFVSTPDSRASGESIYVSADKPSNTSLGQTPGAEQRKEPPNPLTKFKVSSWWKMGGGADDLKASTEACVARLGPEHKPDMQAQVMTRGLILCLKEKGWYGLQGY